MLFMLIPASTRHSGVAGASYGPHLETEKTDPIRKDGLWEETTITLQYRENTTLTTLSHPGLSATSHLHQFVPGGLRGIEKKRLGSSEELFHATLNHFHSCIS